MQFTIYFYGMHKTTNMYTRRTCLVKEKRCGATCYPRKYTTTFIFVMEDINLREIVEFVREMIEFYS